jgi:hypothetical protein
LDGLTLENGSDKVSQKSINQRKLIPLNIPTERKPQLPEARQRYTTFFNFIQAPAVSSSLVSNNESNNTLVITFKETPHSIFYA